MNFPADLKYTKDHEWVRVDGDSAVVGITEFAQSELGDIVFVDLPGSGKTVAQKGTLCVVESTKAASDVYSPVGGTVKESNAELSSSPELINKDPYGKGWLVKLSSVAKADLDKLMNAQQYKDLLGPRANG